MSRVKAPQRLARLTRRKRRSKRGKAGSFRRTSRRGH